MINRKYLKYMTTLLIFVMTLNLNIGINMNQYGTSSTPNKHFLQLGIGEVEAAGEWELVCSDSLEDSSNMYGLYKKRTELKLNYYDLVFTYYTAEGHRYNEESGVLERFHISNNEEYKFVFDSVSRYGKGAYIASGIVEINGKEFEAGEYDPELLPKEFIIGRNTSEFWAYTSCSAANESASHKIRFRLYKRSLNNNPSLTITAPTSNSPLSEADTAFVPSISVSDPDDDTLTCKYYIDSETTPRDTKTATSTATAKTVNFNPINIGTLTEGNHTMKFEVSDGKAAAVTASVAFKVDKTPPTLGAVTFSSTTTGITISGTATDSIAGMDPYPYRYTVSTKTATSWVNATTYTQTGLSPNTQYTATFEARDIKAHIAKKTQNIYTKAQVPSAVTVNNPTSYTLDVSVTDGNPAATQYQISLNNNTKYVTPEGTLTTSPVWITLSGKKITVKGLSPSTAYTFQVKAKNGDGVETTQSSGVSGTTLIAPPVAPANIIATATDKTITVSWEGAATATGYDIEADGVIINRGTSTTFTHTNLYPGTPHTYRVSRCSAKLNPLILLDL